MRHRNGREVHAVSRDDGTTLDVDHCINICDNHTERRSDRTAKCTGCRCCIDCAGRRYIGRIDGNMSICGRPCNEQTGRVVRCGRRQGDVAAGDFRRGSSSVTQQDFRGTTASAYRFK